MGIKNESVVPPSKYCIAPNVRPRKLVFSKFEVSDVCTPFILVVSFVLNGLEAARYLVNLIVMRLKHLLKLPGCTCETVLYLQKFVQSSLNYKTMYFLKVAFKAL